MSIYITGDIHGNPQRLSNASFPAGKQLTKEDLLCITQSGAKQYAEVQDMLGKKADGN